MRTRSVDLSGIDLHEWAGHELLDLLIEAALAHAPADGLPNEVGFAFTGVIRDKLGRRVTFVEGKRVKAAAATHPDVKSEDEHVQAIHDYMGGRMVPTGEHAEHLAHHLSHLTKDQLHQLRHAYGHHNEVGTRLKKGELVAKLAERFAAGRKQAAGTAAAEKVGQHATSAAAQPGGSPESRGFVHQDSPVTREYMEATQAFRDRANAAEAKARQDYQKQFPTAPAHVVEAATKAAPAPSLTPRLGRPGGGEKSHEGTAAAEKAANKPVAEYEETSGYKRHYRIEHRGPNHFQNVFDRPETGEHGLTIGGQHRTRAEAAKDLGDHLHRLESHGYTEAPTIHDAEVKKHHAAAVEAKVARAKAEADAKAKEEAERQAKHRANAEAESKLHEMTANAKGRRGSAEIDEGAGRRSVSGEVHGHFLVHKGSGSEKYGGGGYNVTHIPSGLKAGNARSQKEAKHLATLMGMHGDWSKAKPDRETMDYGAGVIRHHRQDNHAELLAHVEKHAGATPKPAAAPASPATPQGQAGSQHQSSAATGTTPLEEHHADKVLTALEHGGYLNRGKGLGEPVDFGTLHKNIERQTGHHLTPEHFKDLMTGLQERRGLELHTLNETRSAAGIHPRLPDLLIPQGVHTRGYAAVNPGREGGEEGAKQRFREAFKDYIRSKKGNRGAGFSAAREEAAFASDLDEVRRRAEAYAEQKNRLMGGNRLQRIAHA